MPQSNGSPTEPVPFKLNAVQLGLCSQRDSDRILADVPERTTDDDDDEDEPSRWGILLRAELCFAFNVLLEIRAGIRRRLELGMAFGLKPERLLLLLLLLSRRRRKKRSELD